MINILAILAALAVVATLYGALYVWFRISLSRFHRVTAEDVLTRWDAELAELSEVDRERRRAQPPVEVLEAIVALPAARRRRFQFNYAR